MNCTFEEGRMLVQTIRDNLDPSDSLVIFCPPFIHLRTVSILIKDVFHLKMGAQNCHEKESGAFTGEISAGMLKSVGCEYLIIGHSERREYFKETDLLLAEKVRIALKYKLSPIFCVGEKLTDREAGNQEQVVENQLNIGLFDHLSKFEFANVVIAYEPVWAIGTGINASPQQAQDMHFFIRNLIAKKYGGETAHLTPILYGGSCKPSNAADLFVQPDVDGGLIGGASIQATDFVAIVQANR